MLRIKCMSTSCEITDRWVSTLMASQHWFKQRFDAISDAMWRQWSGFTWANVDPDHCGHMASLGYYEVSLRGFMVNRVNCRYGAVQFITILHTALWQQRQKVNQILESQKIAYASPSRANNDMFIVRILKQIDRVITAPLCIALTDLCDPYSDLQYPQCRW